MISSPVVSGRVAASLPTRDPKPVEFCSRDPVRHQRISQAPIARKQGAKGNQGSLGKKKIPLDHLGIRRDRSPSSGHHRSRRFSSSSPAARSFDARRALRAPGRGPSGRMVVARSAYLAGRSLPDLVGVTARKQGAEGNQGSLGKKNITLDHLGIRRDRPPSSGHHRSRQSTTKSTTRSWYSWSSARCSGGISSG